MLRSALSWLAVFALLAAGFGATVLALNNDVFSAHGFVRSYLQALERRDADEALAFAGVEVPEGQAATLLVDDALAGVGDIRLLSDVEKGGAHTVRYSYTLGGQEEISEFHVQPDGHTLGLFGRWRFAVAPFARLDVTVVNDSRFTANGVEATAGAPLLVLAPALVALEHDTEFLSASESEVVVAVGETTSVTIEPQPTQAFTEAAADAVAAYLDDCATQQVLMPTACPFGFSEANRVDGLPEWTIEEHPTVTVGTGTGTQPGTWLATGSGGSAHISLVVKSLFDGSTRAVTDSVQFSGEYQLAIGPDDTITVLEASA